MNSSVFSLFLLVFVLQRVESFFWVDCTYDQDTFHVEYACDGEIGIRFSHRTDQLLYCRNFIPGIDRASVRILSFRKCRDSKPPNAVINKYIGLRVYNLSLTGIESLNADWLEYQKFLDNFIASYNDLTEIPGDLFRYTPKITAIDFSFNQIQTIDPFMFDNIRRLKTVRFRHNLIGELHGRLFSNLLDLELLDFSHNRIKTIEKNLLTNNRKLKSLNLNNNQVKRLDCDFLLKFTDSLNSVNIFLNTLEVLTTKCANDRADMEFNVTISTNQSTIATIGNGQFEWIFNKMDFRKLFHLNFANNQKTNLSALLEEANSHLFTLDLSNTLFGELNEKTLQRFAYLKELYLSRTNLTNILFGTFHNQINLKVLDISHNHLGQFDFYLFLRNFQNLEILNLEGNDLTEIDSLSRMYFPKLTTLIISNNKLSCEYLANFLMKWNGLTLVNEPSNQVIMGGVHCIQSHLTTEKPTVIDKPVIQIQNMGTSEANIALSKNQLNELFVIKVLLIILAGMLCTICLCLICNKCRRAMKLYQLTETATGSILFTSQEDNNRIDNHNDNHDVE